MKKVVLANNSLNTLKEKFVKKALFTNKRLEMLNIALNIISALEQEGELIVEKGNYTVYRLCKQDHCNKLEYIGFRKFYLQAAGLVVDGSGVVVWKPFDGEVEYRLIIGDTKSYIGL